MLLANGELSMNDREKILRYYRASDNTDLAARLLDLADAAVKNSKYRTSEFLDPYGYSIAETISAHYPRLELIVSGGYIGAERVKAAFVAKDFMGRVDFGLNAIALTWDVRYHHLSHRDVLGALMAIGIKREVIGDIIIGSHGCQIVLEPSLKSYIIQNFNMVGAISVTVQEIELNEITPQEEKIKEIKGTVAALRLDAVAAIGFGTSRTQMAEEIAAQKVKLNWQDAKGTAQIVKVGDIISMRGRGRVEVYEINGQTKKGRISILLKRFM
jgi:RNA-binding protein YlmH